MTWRIQKGKRPDGTFGFDISKPGIDVTTATIMQMAFSSDYSIPRLVTKGSIVASPIVGAPPETTAPIASNIPGIQQRVSQINYGRTISPMPFVAAIAQAASWAAPLSAQNGQLSFLNGQWHTYVAEIPYAVNGTLDSTYGKQINANTYGRGVWASARFEVRPFPTAVQFLTNCQTPVTIKYIVLEP
jgi:hypothetical protein